MPIIGLDKTIIHRVSSSEKLPVEVGKFVGEFSSLEGHSSQDRGQKAMVVQRESGAKV